MNDVDISLIPDLLPTGEQVKNMQVAILVQASMLRYFNIDGIAVDINFDKPCEAEECVFEAEVIAKGVNPSVAFAKHIQRETGYLVDKFPEKGNSLTDDGQTWHIGSMGWDRGNLQQEASWDIGFSQNRWEDAEILEYSINVDFPKSAIENHLYLGLHDGERFIKVNGGQEYLDIFGSSGNPTVIGYQTLTPDEMPSAAQVKNMRLVIMVSKFFNKFAEIEVVKGKIKYKIPQCGEDICSILPSCSEEELKQQEQSIEEIRELIANTTIENLPIPNELHRIRLCDGSEMNLFQSEIDLLLGDYTVLTSYSIPDDGTTFLVGSDGPEKVHNYGNDLGQIFKTFSPQLENNDTLKCSPDSFAHTLRYVVNVENSWNYIEMYQCPPIAGRRS
jgi:hypothetical protein